MTAPIASAAVIPSLAGTAVETKLGLDQLENSVSARDSNQC